MKGEPTVELKDLRTGLFGFNKNDVCEYLSQLNNIYEQKQQQKNAEQRKMLTELSEKNEELGNTAARLSQQNTELQRANDALQKDFSSLQKKLNDLQTAAEELNRQNGEMQQAAVLALEEAGERLNLAKAQILKLQPKQEPNHEA